MKLYVASASPFGRKASVIVAELGLGARVVQQPETVTPVSCNDDVARDNPLEGLASAEEIDNGMKLGCNHPIGPLVLADMIGLDVMLAVMKVFYEGFNDPKYRPASLLKETVDAGFLGRKSGRGFYNYA